MLNILISSLFREYTCIVRLNNHYIAISIVGPSCLAVPAQQNNTNLAARYHIVLCVYIYIYI
jgi:hypothetical protein